jgi:hypothetical protein
MNIIQESQLLAPISSWAAIEPDSQLYIEYCENYQKRSFRNRYQIATSQGKMMLTVPLSKGKHQQMPITDVTIYYGDPWLAQHLNTIRSAYGKSPFFEYYYDEFAFILSTGFSHLVDLNMALHDWVVAKTKLKMTVNTTTEYHQAYDQTYVDMRGAAKESQNIELLPYVQVWQEKFEFIDNLSILDLLFCEGPNTKNYLQSVKKS